MSELDAARGDMRVEVVKRELNQGALAGFDSAVTEYAAKLVIAALDSFDEEALAAEYRRGFEAGEVNGALLAARAERAEAVIQRVRALADRYDRADPDDIFRGSSIATEIEEALAVLDSTDPVEDAPGTCEHEWVMTLIDAADHMIHCKRCGAVREDTRDAPAPTRSGWVPEDGTPVRAIISSSGSFVVEDFTGSEPDSGLPVDGEERTDG